MTFQRSDGSLGSDYYARTAELSPEQRRTIREFEWAQADIPRRLWPMLHDGAPGEDVGPLAARPTPALDAASRFLSPTNDKAILVLSGNVGTGKTVAAAWACAWNGGRFVKAIDIVRAGVYSDHTWLRQVWRSNVLVVDDVGTEPLDANGWSLSAIGSLFDERYDGSRKTVVTTNLQAQEFKIRYGPRVWRRVLEVGRWFDLGEAVK